MKTSNLFLTLFASAAFSALTPAVDAAELSIETAPPVVIRTTPTAGATNVDAALSEIRVTYSKAMMDGSWSWSTWGEENYPETTGAPNYLADARTCVLPVKLAPGRFYAIWLNSEKFRNFKDADGRSAVPYLLTFHTGGARSPVADNTAQPRQFVRVVLDDQKMTFEGEPTSWERLGSLLSAVPDRRRTVLEWGVPTTQITLQQQNDWSGRFTVLARQHGFEYSSYVGVQAFGSKGGSPPQTQATVPPTSETDFLRLLNDDQRAVLAWTDRQFRNFFDQRAFEGWSSEEIMKLEVRLIDALKGPQSPEYFQAINTLAALRSTNAVPGLSRIAFERADRNNRDRWMAVRALGLIGDQSVVPELIHLVYHGNLNTRWWAQISLVRLTGQNFGKDWDAWAKWWRESGGKPEFRPGIIRWWNGQAEPDKLAETLEENDRKFIEGLKPRSSAASAADSADVAAKVRQAAPVMEAIRDRWSAGVNAIQAGDVTNALAALQALAPRIQEFREAMKDTPLAVGPADALEALKPIMSALEKGDAEGARTAMEPMLALGRKMEEQVKAVTAPAPVPAPDPVPGLTDAIELRRDDGIQKGVRSIAGSGHAVHFERDSRVRYLEAVHIFASRYGTPEAPQEDFQVYVLDEQRVILATVPFPYALFARGEPKWYTLRTPSIEVPEKFTVAMNFNPHRTKGVYLAYTETNGPACHSSVGLPDKGFQPFQQPVEWMVRATLTAEPTKAKGFQPLK